MPRIREPQRPDDGRLDDTPAVDLSAVQHLPAIALRARALLDGLAEGKHPLAMGGQLLKSCAVYSLPIGPNFRLLVDKRTMRALQVVSHSRYNGIASPKRQRRRKEK